jgi:hypothetical protein
VSRPPSNFNSITSIDATTPGEILTLGNETKDKYNKDMIPKFNELLRYLNDLDKRLITLERKV